MQAGKQNSFQVISLSRLMDPRLPQSVIIILLWGRAHHPTTVVTVTPGQQAQLFQGLLVVCHFGPLGEEAGCHAADVESAGTAMQLSQPLAERRSRLEGSHDGYRGDHRGRSCRDGEGLFNQTQVEENETWITRADWNEKYAYSRVGAAGSAGSPEHQGTGWISEGKVASAYWE